MNTLPKFSFSIPTYNAARYLEDCLRSIREQDYPQERVEILVADGGSTDDTVGIARRYEAIVMDNPKRLADYGAKLTFRVATGDFLVTFAADNGLASKDWLSRVAARFTADSTLAAVWGRVISGPDDPAINKYYELIQSDPFTHFLNKNLNHYLRREVYDPKSDFYTFRVDPARPLVWGANGLTYRLDWVRDIVTQDAFIGDNDVFQTMIERGQNKVAYSPSLRTYHHTVASLSDWIGKWRRNYSRHLVEHQDSRNMNWAFTHDFRRKTALWLVYSLFVPISLTHAIYLMLRDRNRYWLYHPVACFAQTMTYGVATLQSRAARGMVANLMQGRVRMPTTHPLGG